MSSNIAKQAETSCCEHCVIRHKAVCGALELDELAKLDRIAHTRSIRAGSVIISDESAPSFFANVISGAIKLTKTLPDGRQQIVGLLFPPDFLGRAYSGSNPYFAEAATDVELCCFSHESFEHLLKEHPGLEHRLFERTLDELDSAREWMLLLGRKSAEERVASFLLLLARRHAMIGRPHRTMPGTPCFELPLKRADIADYLGLTIETVSRQITKLKKSGVIKLHENRVITVPRLEALAEIAGQELPPIH